MLENRYYRVVFDAATGTITSIRDKQLDVELVDQTAPHKFNEYLYERFETPDTKDPVEVASRRVGQVGARRGPVADIVIVKAAPVGVESLRQTVVFYHDLKRMDFGWTS